jgi:polyisoprenoid-binding protein YceI
MTAGARPPVGDLAVDAAGSRVHVAVRKWGWPVHGQLTVAAGRARVTDDPGGCRVTVSAAAASFTTGNHARDRHVRGPAFLDAARWPDLTFASTQVSRRPDGTWDVAGTLTVRGVAAPARFVVDDWWVGDDDRVVASAGGTLSRSALGVGHLRWLVGDRVRVSARLVLVPCR